MAFKNTVALSCANRAAALSEIWTQIAAMGWTLHDNMDGSSYRVYSTNGEDTLKLVGYVKIDFITANRITLTPYYYWNNSTHAGLGINSNTVFIGTSETGCYLWIYGNMDTTCFLSKVGTTYNFAGMGHVQNKFWTKETYLTAGASSGSNVTITVNDTTCFTAGENYQIVSASAEGRDKVLVTTVSDGTHLIISSLPRNYASNSRIGQCPMLFGVIGSGGTFSHICSMNAVGTGTENTQGYTMTYNSAFTSMDPDERGESCFVLQPLLVNDPGSSGSITGYNNAYLLLSPNTGLASEDTFDVDRKDSGTASAGGASTLTDGTKTWGTNVHANRVVVITTGTGAGQIRKIASNTGTVLTTVTAWATNPSTDSVYVISTEAYRWFSLSFGGYGYPALREEA